MEESIDLVVKFLDSFFVITECQYKLLSCFSKYTFRTLVPKDLSHEEERPHGMVVSTMSSHKSTLNLINSLCQSFDWDRICWASEDAIPNEHAHKGFHHVSLQNEHDLLRIWNEDSTLLLFISYPSGEFNRVNRSLSIIRFSVGDLKNVLLVNVSTACSLILPTSYDLTEIFVDHYVCDMSDIISLSRVPQGVSMFCNEPYQDITCITKTNNGFIHQLIHKQTKPHLVWFTFQDMSYVPKYVIHERHTCENT
jgi:hypothetical protein